MIVQLIFKSCDITDFTFHSLRVPVVDHVSIDGREWNASCSSQRYLFHKISLYVVSFVVGFNNERGQIFLSEVRVLIDQLTESWLRWWSHENPVNLFCNFKIPTN